MKKVNIAILGASGYTACELIRLALAHPNIKILYLFGNSKAGFQMGDIYPHLKFENLPKITKISETSLNEIEILFSCLPHTELQKIIHTIPKNIKIIDVSADFRLQNTNLFEEFYNIKHQAPNFLKDACYGLAEYSKNLVKTKRIIACPGCYPTSILLPLLPIINSISEKKIIIDSKSGISGSGRKTSIGNLFCEVNENITPYNIQKHRHLAEIIENIENIGKEKFEIQFTPHIIPISRGILSTIYVSSKLSANELKSKLKSHYQTAKFINIHDDDYIPQLKNVIGSNNCEINIFDKQNSDLKIIISVIDNLNRGSSGQAIMNFNHIYDFEENTGLDHFILFP